MQFINFQKSNDEYGGPQLPTFQCKANLIIWRFKNTKKQNRIEICKGSMKNLICDSATCITTSLTLWPWCMTITSGHKILILMLNFWIWTNKKSWFKNDVMCNVVQQFITPKPLINYQSLNSTITISKSQHWICKVFQNIANGGLLLNL